LFINMRHTSKQHQTEQHKAVSQNPQDCRCSPLKPLFLTLQPSWHTLCPLRCSWAHACTMHMHTQPAAMRGLNHCKSLTEQCGTRSPTTHVWFGLNPTKHHQPSTHRPCANNTTQHTRPWQDQDTQTGRTHTTHLPGCVKN
jgi:hypothetical protein